MYITNICVQCFQYYKNGYQTIAENLRTLNTNTFVPLKEDVVKYSSVIKKKIKVKILKVKILVFSLFNTTSMVIRTKMQI